MNVFRTLRDHSVGEHIEVSEETNVEAEKEYGCEKGYEAMKAEWTRGEFCLFELASALLLSYETGSLALGSMVAC